MCVISPRVGHLTHPSAADADAAARRGAVRGEKTSLTRCGRTRPFGQSRVVVLLRGYRKDRDARRGFSSRSVVITVPIRVFIFPFFVSYLLKEFCLFVFPPFISNSIEKKTVFHSALVLISRYLQYYAEVLGTKSELRML